LRQENKLFKYTIRSVSYVSLFQALLGTTDSEAQPDTSLWSKCWCTQANVIYVASKLIVPLEHTVSRSYQKLQNANTQICVQAMRQSGCPHPLKHNFDTKWRWVVCFKLRPL